MTVEEVLHHSMNILSEINVPISLMDQIGEPIRRVISNLQLCVDAFEENKKRNEEPEKPEPETEAEGKEPEVEVIGEEES